MLSETNATRNGARAGFKQTMEVHMENWKQELQLKFKAANMRGNRREIALLQETWSSFVIAENQMLKEAKKQYDELETPQEVTA